MNLAEFKAEMIRQNKSVSELAKSISVSVATFYKKQKNNSFTIGEIKTIANELSLSESVMFKIFFNH